MSKVNYIKTSTPGWVIDPKTNAVLNLNSVEKLLHEQQKKHLKEMQAVQDKINSLEQLVLKLLESK